MDHYCYLCFMFVVLSCFFIADLCHLLGKADLLARLYMKFLVTFPFGVQGQVWCLIVSIPDL